DTYSDNDRVLMNNEFKQMEEEINRIISQTKWNKINLFDYSLCLIGTSRLLDLLKHLLAQKA
ncbi:MAG: hypothetical protein ACPG88_07250, partial [Porticoccaceae bacterium]